MEEASNKYVVLPDSEKKMDKKQSSSLGDGKESLKLRISTNHADGTSKIISNHGSSSHNHNHVSKEKDGIGKDDVSKSKHGHDGEKRKEHKHKAIKDSSEKHREHKSHSESHKMSSDSKKHNDSNSKPKENSYNSGSKDIKNKENSSSSKPKDGHNNSITKMKDSMSKSSDSKSSPVKDGGSKPKHSSSVKSSPGDQSTKTKVPSANLNHSAKENNITSTPKEHGSSSKPKESNKHKDSSSKPKENSIGKPKENSIGKPKEISSSHKPKENNSSSSHKSKENSISKPKENSSNSKPKESSKPKDSSNSSSVKPKEGSNSNKHSDSSSKQSSSLNSTSKPKENGEKSSGSSSNKSKSSGDKISSSHSSKPKDASSNDRDISKSSSKSGEKLNSSFSPIKVKQDKPDSEKRHQHSKESSDKKEHKKESSSKEKTKDIKPVHKIKQEVNDKSLEKHDSSFLKDDNHKVNDSYKSNANISIKNESFSEDDVPLSARKAELIKQDRRKDLKREQTTEKRYKEASDSEDEPLSARIENVKRLKKEQTKPSKKRKADDSDDEPISKKSKKTVQNKQTQNQMSSPTKSPTKKKKEEEQEVWKWWEEEKLDEGVKWKTLEHKGPVFAPDYEVLPKSVKFFYDGDHLELRPETEEVATFYSKLLDHDYTSKEVFNKNFFKDWRKVMTAQEKQTITDLKLCNFKQMQQYFLQKTEDRKAMTKDQKLIVKKENEELQKEYGFCIIDGHKEKIGNFKIEPPGLFRGRGEHPKMGMLKKRTMPEEVIINCSKGSKVPQPPKGHKWKEVRHDNAVTWLACWTESIQGSNKYIMLNPSSKLKGEKDMQKYEVARKLKNCVDTIRDNYRKDWKSKEMRIRQRAVALYFIDKLALRAGNEKEEGETADTVGCCSLRFEHITLDEERDGQEFVVNFDFLGKDSIRYVNNVPVEKRVFKNLQLFMENKQSGDDLFDRLNTTTLNKHLSELMDGLTAKVFRTFNASKTLQEQLDKLTNPDDPIPAKMLSYNRANRAVAILCNHQRAVPKTFDKSMENLQSKIQAKRDQIKEAKQELKDAKKGRDRNLSQKKEKALERLKDQLIRLELSATDKEENKQVALGTSKLNYLDPRITVAWSKKWEVPIEKVYNRTQRDKFRWAIEMAGPDYVF